MAKRKSSTETTPQALPAEVITINHPVVHVTTKATVQFGYVKDGNLVPCDPVEFHMNVVNETTLSEFWGLVEQTRQALILQINAPPPTAVAEPPAAE